MYGPHKPLQMWLTCMFYTILLMSVSESDNAIVCYNVGKAITNAKVRGPSHPSSGSDVYA